MDILYVISDTLAITLFLLISLSFALSAPTRPIAWLMGLLAFSYIAYLLSARQDYGYYIPETFELSFGIFYPVLDIARNSISAEFLLLTHFLFRDTEKFPRVLILLIATQLIVDVPLAWLVGSAWAVANPTWAFLLYEALPACLQMIFLVVATYWVVIELRFDLVRKRRTARILMLCIVAGQGLLSLVVERIGFLGGFIANDSMYPMHNLFIAIQALFFAIFLVTLLRRDVLDFVSDRPSVEPLEDPNTASKSREVERLRGLLENERVYRQMGLTVADLARLVAIPQYRLRELIHDELGFRNFNAFLHHYRVAEVAEALEDVNQNQTPILTLALAAGYQSINPFNRAFKELKGVTPSEYRTSR